MPREDNTSYTLERCRISVYMIEMHRRQRLFLLLGEALPLPFFHMTFFSLPSA